MLRGWRGVAYTIAKAVVYGRSWGSHGPWCLLHRANARCDPAQCGV